MPTGRVFPNPRNSECEQPIWLRVGKGTRSMNIGILALPFVLAARFGAFEGVVAATSPLRQVYTLAQHLGLGGTD